VACNRTTQHFHIQNFLFQDDNALVHRAGDVEHYKARNPIHSISWPAQLPHLNIMENLWVKLKRRLKYRVGNIGTAAELEDAIRQEWQSLTVDYIQGLHKSMPRRLRKVIRVKNEITKY
jgi:hypothetical protein